MLLTSKKLVFLADEIKEGKNGPYRLVTLGCPESYSKVNLIVLNGSLVDARKGEEVIAEIDLEQSGSFLRATLKTLVSCLNE